MTQRQHLLPTGPRLGRGLVNHDDRSKDHRAVDLTDATELRTRHWRRAGAYDQGQSPECVAYTGKGLLNSTPVDAGVPWRVRSKLDPDVLYAGAQANDEWPGEAYEGTSALGLCRYLKGEGLIRSYAWCFGLTETLLTLSQVGPVGIGVQWMSGMWDPDQYGFLHATGNVVGGHEVELTGIDMDLKAVVLTNSWGKAWGRNGRAFLTWDDLAELLANEGDAVTVQ